MPGTNPPHTVWRIEAIVGLARTQRHSATKTSSRSGRSARMAQNAATTRDSNCVYLATTAVWPDASEKEARAIVQAGLAQSLPSSVLHVGCARRLLSVSRFAGSAAKEFKASFSQSVARVQCGGLCAVDHKNALDLPTVPRSPSNGSGSGVALEKAQAEKEMPWGGTEST